MYDFRKRSDDAMYFCDEKSLTKQDFRAECNINNILKKYRNAGVDPHVITKAARYGDFSAVPTYQEALDYVIRAEDEFDALPATLRARFHNNPQRMLDFIADDNNYSEALKLGLIEPKKEVEPIKVQVVQNMSEQTST